MSFQGLERGMSNLKAQFDLQEIVKRAIKYLIEGGAVAIVAFYLPEKQMKIENILVIAITAACTFAILDMWAPSISNTARQGAGFGIGANLVGFPSTANPPAGPGYIRM